MAFALNYRAAASFSAAAAAPPAPQKQDLNSQDLRHLRPLESLFQPIEPLLVLPLNEAQQRQFFRPLDEYRKPLKLVSDLRQDLREYETLQNLDQGGILAKLWTFFSTILDAEGRFFYSEKSENHYLDVQQINETELRCIAYFCADIDLKNAEGVPSKNPVNIFQLQSRFEYFVVNQNSKPLVRNPLLTLGIRKNDQVISRADLTHVKFSFGNIPYFIYVLEQALMGASVSNEALNNLANYINSVNYHLIRDHDYARVVQHSFYLEEHIKMLQFAQEKGLPMVKQSIRSVIVLPKTAKAWYQEGREQYGLNQYSQAIESLSQAAHIERGYADAYHRRGRAYYAMANYHLAIDDFNRVLGIKPKDIDALYERGRTNFKLQRYEAATGDFEQVLSLRPDDPDAPGRLKLAQEALIKHPQVAFAVVIPFPLGFIRPPPLLSNLG